MDNTIFTHFVFRLLLAGTSIVEGTSPTSSSVSTLHRIRSNYYRRDTNTDIIDHNDLGVNDWEHSRSTRLLMEEGDNVPDEIGYRMTVMVDLSSLIDWKPASEVSNEEDEAQKEKDEGAAIEDKFMSDLTAIAKVTPDTRLVFHSIMVDRNDESQSSIVFDILPALPSAAPPSSHQAEGGGVTAPIAHDAYAAQALMQFIEAEITTMAKAVTDGEVTANIRIDIMQPHVTEVEYTWCSATGRWSMECAGDETLDTSAEAVQEFKSNTNTSESKSEIMWVMIMTLCGVMLAASIFIVRGQIFRRSSSTNANSGAWANDIDEDESCRGQVQDLCNEALSCLSDLPKSFCYYYPSFLPFKKHYDERYIGVGSDNVHPRAFRNATSINGNNNHIDALGGPGMGITDWATVPVTESDSQSVSNRDEDLGLDLHQSYHDAYNTIHGTGSRPRPGSNNTSSSTANSGYNAGNTIGQNGDIDDFTFKIDQNLDFDDLQLHLDPNELDADHDMRGQETEAEFTDIGDQSEYEHDGGAASHFLVSDTEAGFNEIAGITSDARDRSDVEAELP